jgi:hypothetical protein
MATLYCTTSEASIDEGTLANTVVRCLTEQRQSIPAFAVAWYKEKFGAEYKTVEAWIDRRNTGLVPSPDIASESNSGNGLSSPIP